MIGDNATVSTLRKGVFNAATKTTAGYVTHLTNLSCYIADPSRQAYARGFAIEYDHTLTCEVGTDIQDGDQVSGWNPQGLPTPPLYVVNHVAVYAGGIGAHKTAYLKVFRTQ